MWTGFHHGPCGDPVQARQEPNSCDQGSCRKKGERCAGCLKSRVARKPQGWGSLETRLAVLIVKRHCKMSSKRIDKLTPLKHSNSVPVRTDIPFLMFAYWCSLVHLRGCQEKTILRDQFTTLQRSEVCCGFILSRRPAPKRAAYSIDTCISLYHHLTFYRLPLSWKRFLSQLSLQH